MAFCCDHDGFSPGLALLHPPRCEPVSFLSFFPNVFVILKFEHFIFAPAAPSHAIIELSVVEVSGRHPSSRELFPLRAGL